MFAVFIRVTYWINNTQVASILDTTQSQSEDEGGGREQGRGEEGGGEILT